LGFSLVQAAIFGSLLGLMAFYRVQRGGRDELVDDELAWHQRVRAGLERLELPFFDWRLRALGDRSERSDEVVVVAVDRETLDNARQAESPAFGVQPWPRELVGGLIQRMLKEGADIVVLDGVMADASPVGVRPALRATPAPEATDDDGLRRHIDLQPGRTVLGFGWRRERGTAPVTGLYPYLLAVGKAESSTAAEGSVRRVLAQRRPAFVIPEGQGVQVWAGVSSAEDGSRLASGLDLKGSPQVREYATPERKYQVTSVDLLTSMAEVHVQGLNAERLTRVRSLEPPFPLLLGRSSRFGALELRPDPDGIVRSVPLLVAFEPKEGEIHVMPSAPLSAAMQLAGTSVLTYQKGKLQIGDRFVIPMDPTGHSLIRWDASDAARDARGSVRRALPAWRIVVNELDAAADRPAHYDNDLEHRSVIFTDTAGPFASWRDTPVGRRVPQGAIVAQVLTNILRSEGIRRVEPRWDLIATFALAFMGAFLALTFSGLFRSTLGALVYFSSLAGTGAAYAFFAHSLFLNEGLWLAIAAPLVAMTASFVATTGYVFRTEAQLRDFVYGALGRYVSPELARRVHRDLSLMRPERRRVTVCACDLEGFTYRTRDLPPEKLASFLGEYLTVVGNVVRRTGGLMDRHGGDQIIGFWGAPLLNEHHARDACSAAVELQNAIAARASGWQSRFGIELRLRTAVETGEAVVGEIGATTLPDQSYAESSYSIVGGVVSLATALTKSNAGYGTRVLVSEATAAQAGDEFSFREADRMLLRSDKRPTVVYELLGRAISLTEPQKYLLRDFTAAIEAYHGRKFDVAKALFERCAEQHNDTLSKLYASRAAHYLQRPPPPEWDQVYEQRPFPGA
jgi:adenylate cyclase